MAPAGPDPAPLVRTREPLDLNDLAGIFACPSVVAGTPWLPFRPLAAVQARLDDADPNLHALVAEFGGRVVGSIGRRAAANPHRHVGDLGLAMYEAFPGRGGGTVLVAAPDLADRWLALRRVDLGVFAVNAVAFHRYQRFGFEREGVSREFAARNGEHADALLMARLNRGACPVAPDTATEQPSGAGER